MYQLSELALHMCNVTHKLCSYSKSCVVACNFRMFPLGLFLELQPC